MDRNRDILVKPSRKRGGVIMTLLGGYTQHSFTGPYKNLVRVQGVLPAYGDDEEERSLPGGSIVLLYPELEDGYAEAARALLGPRIYDEISRSAEGVMYQEHTIKVSASEFLEILQKIDEMAEAEGDRNRR